ILQQRVNSNPLIVSLMMFDRAIELARHRIALPEKDMDAQVLAYQAELRLPKFISNAVQFEAMYYLPSKDKMLAVLAMPYRPAAHGRKLLVHDFRLLEFSGGAEASACLRAGLFSRMDEAPGHWRDYYADEDDARHLAERRAAMPLLPWEDPEILEGQPETFCLDDFDVAAWLKALPGDETAYLDVKLPPELASDPLNTSVANFPTLLCEGRVVWGALVQANDDLFMPGVFDAAPAEIVYSIDGSVPPDDLKAIGRALFTLRKQLPPYPYADDALKKYTAYLKIETERAFGLPVPASAAALAGMPEPLPDTLRTSALWVVRKHLPRGYLASGVFPLLISDRCPGHAMIVPARAWPPLLLALWEGFGKLLAASGAVAEQSAPHKLDDFDVAAWLQALPGPELDYLDAEPPRGLASDPLGVSVANFPTLLREGRGVWGSLVMANGDLFKPGAYSGLPAEILYSIDGSVPPDDLAPIASALFKLREQLPPHADDALKKYANYLNAETGRAFGLPVSASVASLPGVPEHSRLHVLRTSTLWVVRKHLPHAYLAHGILPLLVSDRCPGHVMIVPARAWPSGLLALWKSKTAEEQPKTFSLDDFDVAGWLAALSRAEMADLLVQPPRAIASDPLGKTIANFPALLREGRVVWGVLAQDNDDLFKPGANDLPAEIVYSVDGSMSPDDLAPMASVLSQQHKPVLPQDNDALKKLNTLIQHAFGQSVPARSVSLPYDMRLHNTLRTSRLWVVRGHLPYGYLASSVLPLLVSDRYPGQVMIVPATAWPPALLASWKRHHEAQKLAKAGRRRI
ncbi:MAG: hypothetical protein LBS49_08540, partial [Candidatus Accumulibacter sp.]|nr:hypothetical protein [Accumulibacter sp.]